MPRPLSHHPLLASQDFAPKHRPDEEGRGPGWAPNVLEQLWRCSGPWEGPLLVVLHRPHCLFSPGPSSPPAPSSWAGNAGLPGAGPRSWSQVKACLCPIGLLSLPGCGNVRGQEGGRLLGAAGAVWYSHYQPSGEDQASRPLGHCGCLHTSTLPVDTRPPSPGQRCQLGNKGVQGPPKQPGSRPLRERRMHFWGGWEAAGMCPGRPREKARPVPLE